MIDRAAWERRWEQEPRLRPPLGYIAGLTAEEFARRLASIAISDLDLVRPDLAEAQLGRVFLGAGLRELWAVAEAARAIVDGAVHGDTERHLEAALAALDAKETP